MQPKEYTECNAFPYDLYCPSTSLDDGNVSLQKMPEDMYNQKAPLKIQGHTASFICWGQHVDEIADDEQEQDVDIEDRSCLIPDLNKFMANMGNIMSLDQK